MAIGLAAANFIGTLLEMIVFGGYTLLFVQHMSLLLKRRNKSPGYIYLMVTSVLLYSLALMHAVLDIFRLYNAFVGNMAIANGASIFFDQLDTPIDVFRNALYNIITIVSDLFLVYRTWIVWGKNYWIVLVPLLICLGDIAISIWTTNLINVAQSGSPFAATQVGLASKYLFAVTLSETLICTALISYKIWSVQRQTSSFIGSRGSSVVGGTRLYGVMVIIIESAAIYCAILAALIATDVVGSAVFFLLLDMISPMVGMVFSLIIVRAGSPNDSETYTMASTAFNIRRGTSAGETTLGSSGRSGVQIHLETVSQSGSKNFNDKVDHVV